jgi:hypothetical protein
MLWLRFRQQMSNPNGYLPNLRADARPVQPNLRHGFYAGGKGVMELTPEGRRIPAQARRVRPRKPQPGDLGGPCRHLARACDRGLRSRRPVSAVRTRRLSTRWV